MISDDSKVLTVSGDDDGGERTVQALADAVIAAERTIADARPERVVLTDDSDLALAAALAATKLDLPVAATAAAREAPTTNGRLIAQLASDPRA